MYRHEYYVQHRKERLAYAKEWYLRRKEHVRLYNKQYQTNNAETVAQNRNKPENKEKMRRWYQERKDQISQNAQAVKLLVLTHYGNEQPQCVKCGSDDIRVLSLDHINGCEQNYPRSGTWLYRWTVKNGFPDSFQTLCMNCQMIKRFENEEFRSVVID